MEIQVTQDIKLDRVDCLLTSAFEGGSNYWYMIEKEILPKAWTYRAFTNSGTAEKHYAQEVPLNGGTLLISVTDDEDKKGKRYKLNMRSMKKGLEIMARDYPRHFSDMLTENDDAITGDVFLQCCLFGEIVYG